VTKESCSWCGTGIEGDDGWRAAEPAGERIAAFCRLEHVFPWWARGAFWQPGTIRQPAHLLDSLTDCAHCGDPLPDTRVLLVRHRGGHRIPDGFCSAEHMAQWAKKGGRWAP
jgi:hypothetical protein